MMGKKRARSRYVIAAGLAITALTAVSAVPANGAVGDNKTYTVESTASVLAGDRDAIITVKITNTSPNQSLGSANLTLPSQFALVSATKVPAPVPPASADAVSGDNIVQLRNLGLAPNGGFVTVAVTVDVRICAATTPLSFTVTAKQSNDYNGTGNEFYPVVTTKNVGVTGQCQLKFVGQPADALRNATITTVDYALPAPGVDPVSVEVLDAGGVNRIGPSTSLAAPIDLKLATNPGGIDPSPTFSASPNSAGLASFVPALGVSAFNYSFRASSVGLDSQPVSSFFDIVDQKVTCVGDCPATDPVKKGNVTVTTDFGPGEDPANLLVSLGAGDAPGFSCLAYPRTASTVLSQFVFTPAPGTIGTFDPSDRTGTFTISFPDVNRPLNSYEVCWAAPYLFQADGGSPAVLSSFVKPSTSQQLYVGTLPDCKHNTPIPCVASRSFKKAPGSSTGTITLIVNADGRDPWAY